MFKERYCVVSFFKKGRIVMFVESPSNIHFVETSSTAVPNNFTDKYVQRRVVADCKFNKLCPDNIFLFGYSHLEKQ